MFFWQNEVPRTQTLPKRMNPALDFQASTTVQYGFAKIETSGYSKAQSKAEVSPWVSSALNSGGSLQLDVSGIAPPVAPAVTQQPVVTVLRVGTVADQLNS
jgi:hypothetical protein